AGQWLACVGNWAANVHSHCPARPVLSSMGAGDLDSDELERLEPKTEFRLCEDAWIHHYKLRCASVAKERKQTFQLGCVRTPAILTNLKRLRVLNFIGLIISVKLSEFGAIFLCYVLVPVREPVANLFAAGLQFSRVAGDEISRTIRTALQKLGFHDAESVELFFDH